MPTDTKTGHLPPPDLPARYCVRMFSSSQEKQPLKADAQAKSALDQLSSSFGGSTYMSGPPPSRQDSMPQKIMAELKRKWWLWGCLAFTVLLLGSLFVFRSSLYDSAQHGLPFLAVKEAAAEECASVCKEQTSKADAVTTDSYDACYAKCVAQETKEIAAERSDFKKSEEELDKSVESKAEAVSQAAGSTTP